VHCFTRLTRARRVSNIQPACRPGYDVVYTGHRKPRARNCEKLVNRWTAARRAMVG
jgi:hypothetical protein